MPEHDKPSSQETATLPSIRWEALPEEAKTKDANAAVWSGTQSIQVYHDFHRLNVFLQDYQKSKQADPNALQLGVGNAQSLKELISNDLNGIQEGTLTITVKGNIYEVPVDPDNLCRLKEALGASSFSAQNTITRAQSDNLTDAALIQRINDAFDENLQRQNFKPRNSVQR